MNILLTVDLKLVPFHQILADEFHSICRWVLYVLAHPETIWSAPVCSKCSSCGARARWCVAPGINARCFAHRACVNTDLTREHLRYEHFAHSTFKTDAILSISCACVSFTLYLSFICFLSLAFNSIRASVWNWAFFIFSLKVVRALDQTHWRFD